MFLFFLSNIISIFPGSNTLNQLLAQAYARQQKAYAKGTSSNHKGQMLVYLEFCEILGVQPLKPSVKTALSYLEYLSQHLKSHKSVKNYFSAISTLHKAHDLKFKAKKSYHVKIMLKAITVTLKEANNRKLPISMDQLKAIVQYTKSLGDIGVVLKWEYYLHFMGSSGSLT